MKNQLKNRLIYLYKHGKNNYLSQIVYSNKWKESIYRKKYLNTLNRYEDEIKKRINISLNNLKNEKDKLTEEKSRKKYLITEKNKEFENLENDKIYKNEYLNKIKNQKKVLEEQLTRNKKMLTESCEHKLLTTSG